MVLGHLFRDVFRRRTTPAAETREQQLQSAVEWAAGIVANYGEVLSDDGPRSFVLDVARLPHPKEEIKAAIRLLLKITSEPKMREHLKTGYISLSAYQPLTEPQRRALQQWNSSVGRPRPNSKSELIEEAKRISETSDVIGALHLFVVNEMETLLRELETEGNRVQ